jgi:hypothetical protein
MTEVIAAMRRTASLDLLRLRHLLQGQHDVITRAQALESGLTRSALAHRIRPGGPWQVLLPGVYLCVTGRPDRDQLDMAALLYAGPDSMLTGLAALRRHGLAAPDASVIDVLVPAGRQCRSRSLVAVQRSTRIPADILVTGAIRCAPQARAVADAVRRTTDVRQARALTAAALASGACSLQQLERELAEGPVRHSALLREVIGSIREGTGSAPRGALRALLTRSRLPLPVFDASIYDGARMIARVDAWWAEAGVAAELGSGGWQLVPGNWEEAMRRQTRLAERGIIVLQLSADQLEDEPDAVLAAVRNALAAGASRGPVLDSAPPAGPASRSGRPAPQASPRAR